MKSGIYKILNVKTNDFYIGSSKNLIRREKDHFRLLEKNKSHSTILQRAYNKYGKENFKFIVLAYCTEEYLFMIEQWFVDTLNPKYNVCKVDVSVPIGLDHQKYFDKNQYKKMAIDRLKNNPNFGWKSQPIVKLDDNGNIICEYKSLKEYSIEHNCSIGNVGRALKKGNRCKGYYIKYKE